MLRAVIKSGAIAFLIAVLSAASLDLTFVSGFAIYSLAGAAMLSLPIMAELQHERKGASGAAKPRL